MGGEHITSWLTSPVGRKNLSHILLYVLLLFCLEVGWGCAFSCAAEKHILMINSYHQRMPWVRDIVRGVEDVLLPNENSLTFHIENMDSKEFHSDEYFQAFKEYISVKYGESRIELLLSSDNNAYDFLRENRDTLFPGVPVFFCGVNNFDEQQLVGLPGITGATEVFSAYETIRQALDLVPNIRKVYVINDYLKTGRFWEADIRKQVTGLEGEVDFEYAENLSMDELLQHVGSLEADTVVLLGAYFSDRNQQFYSYEHVARWLSTASSVPVFSLVEFIIDEGMVGGQVISGYYQGRAVASLAREFLQGKNVDEIAVVKKGSNWAIYNYEQLVRFGLKEENLPPGAMTIQRPFSFYGEYKQQIWVVISFICILLAAILLLIANVQKRKSVEIALRMSEKRFRQLAESTWEALIIHDNGVLLEANQMFSQLFGYTVEELRGVQIVPILFSEKYQKITSEKFKRGDVDKYEALARRRDGNDFPIEVRIRTMEYEGRETRVAAIRDLTERKRMEEQLTQSRKLEAIGTLAGGIAHDFNNILSAVIGYAEILLLKKSREQEDAEKLQQILRAGNRAKLLVQQILTFARKTEGKSEPVQLSLVVREAIKLLQATLPSSIEFMCHILAEGCVRGDTTKMHQLVMNLCTNAGKSMSEGGVIHITLQESEVSVEMAERYPGVVAGVFHCLTVADSGRGISKEDLSKIFDPFYTSDESQKGTGLGLSVVHGIVQECRGIIEVESTEGVGSSFRIYLPKFVCTVPVEQKEVEVLPTGTESVMVIDDEDDLISVVSETLSRLGYGVQGFSDGREALEAFIRDPAFYDLVITDMTMPGIGGDEVSRQLLKRRPNLPIVICTGHSENFQESDAREIGVKRFLVKPVSMSSLAVTVRNVLDENVG